MSHRIERDGSACAIAEAIDAPAESPKLPGYIVCNRHELGPPGMGGCADVNHPSSSPERLVRSQVVGQSPAP